jgi:high mobility group protein B1
MGLEQPKKPVGGAYGLFVNENRPKFSEEAKASGKAQWITLVSKIGSEKWKALPQAEKDKYQKKFEAIKEKYDKDLEAFKAAGGEVEKKKRKGKDDGTGKRRKKDPDAPKKPAGGAYGCFVAKNRAEFMKQCPGKPASEVSKIAGAKWKTMSAAEKQPYEDEYQKKKVAYEAAKAEYAKKNPAAAADDAEEDDDEEEEEEAAEEGAPIAKKPAAK